MFLSCFFKYDINHTIYKCIIIYTFNLKFVHIMINLSTIKKFNELNDEIINKAIEVEKMCDELKHHEFEWYNNNAVTNFALSVDLTDALDSFNYGDYKEAWYIIDKVVDYVTEVYCHAEINEHTEISVAVKDILVLIDKIEDIFNK